MLNPFDRICLFHRTFVTDVRAFALCLSPCHLCATFVDVVSTSPQKASGQVVTSASAFNPMDYDVEVVEIHIEEDELKHIIP